MKPSISDLPPTRDRNIINIPAHTHRMLMQTTPQEWEFIFDQFRLNLQGRISGADERTLLKLQANIEYSNELETFFKEVIKKPAA